MTYEAYLGLTREELLAKLSVKLSSKRLKHMIGVEATALALAEHYGLDSDKAGLAALLHDYAKEESDQVFLDLIDHYQLGDDLKKWGNNVWHGLLGVYIIKDELGLTDSDILQAIERHTVGASDMTDLDKVVYIADYIEPNRDFPGVETARSLAYQSLDEAVAYATARTIGHLVSKGLSIYPQTLDTYNAFAGYVKPEWMK